MNDEDQISLDQLKKILKATEEAIDEIWKALKILNQIAEIQFQHGRTVILNSCVQLGGELQFLEIKSIGLRRMIDERNNGSGDGGIVDPVIVDPLPPFDPDNFGDIPF